MKKTSIIHRCPAWIKILIVPVVSVVFFNAPLVVSVVMLGMIFAVEFALKFTLREMFGDTRFVLYYAAILIFFRGKEVVPMLLRLFCMIQLASLIFKTSTSLELREGFGKIELAVRKVFHLKKRTTVANALSLFVCFIPLVSKNWNQCKLAWKARGGKNFIKMYVVLLPVFFSVGMKQAYLTARAITAREASLPQN